MADTRRDFIKKTVAGTVGLAAGSSLMDLKAVNYNRITGANDRIGIAVIGVNSRGSSLARTFADQSGVDIRYICDADTNAIEKTVNLVNSTNGQIPKGIKDFRTILDDRDLGAIIIAMPDHWHAPATILGCQAGKHVYIEKPLSHNPNEGELAVKAAEKYNRIVQIGTQRRSWPVVAQGIKELKEGVIGKIYMAKAWYANTRGPIGTGKVVPVPEKLDYELWQGPAPRRPYRDNLIHYNWHWFWNWGTGESLNNGTHHIDLIRWGLGLDYPLKVSSSGGRFHYNDDWETPDTQVITWEAPGVVVTWEGRSCNGSFIDNRSHGVIFHGENGSLHTGDNNYSVYDIRNKLVKEVKSDLLIEGALNTTSPGEYLDEVHIRDFLDNIRNNRKPLADVINGHKSTLWMQLGNIAQRVGRSLNIDPANGHIIGDKAANKLWTREYEKGWEPKV